MLGRDSSSNSLRASLAPAGETAEPPRGVGPSVAAITLMLSTRSTVIAESLILDTIPVVLSSLATSAGVGSGVPKCRPTGDRSHEEHVSQETSNGKVAGHIRHRGVIPRHPGGLPDTGCD